MKIDKGSFEDPKEPGKLENCNLAKEYPEYWKKYKHNYGAKLKILTLYREIKTFLFN